MSSVSVRQQAKSSNITSKIMKLERKFSNSEQQAHQLASASSLSSASSTSSNESFGHTTSSSIKYSQSPKFVHLLQRQMDFHEEEVICDEGEFKSTTQTSTGLKSILRKVVAPEPTAEFSSTSTPLAIDSTSCVLPSNLRQRPLTVTTVTPKKAAVATISSHIAKTNSPLNKLIKTDSNNNNVPKQCSGSVAPMCGGFVKNNMAFFNKNSTPANSTGVSVVKK